MVNGFELEEHYNENVKPRARKVLDTILEFGATQSVCPKIDNCNYVINEMKRLHFNISQANGYTTLICEKYPLVCELNQEELKLARNNL